MNKEKWDTITLPDYEDKIIQHPCHCGGFLRSVIVNRPISYISKYGRFWLTNARVYKCESCGWEMATGVTFDIAEEAAKQHNSAKGIIISEEERISLGVEAIKTYISNANSKEAE